MKRKSILLLIFLSVYFLFACGNKAPLKYKVNKTPELKQYESEVQEKAAFQQSLVEESMAEKARLEEEEKAKEALVWKKKKEKKCEAFILRIIQPVPNAWIRFSKACRERS